MLKRLLLKIDEVAIELVISIFILVFLVAYFSPLIFYNIEPGSVGVLWRRFDGGTVTEPGAFIPEGMHMIWPWDKVYIYDAHLRQSERTFEVLTADGLHVTVDVAYRYRINADTVGVLHKYVGENWEEVILGPEIAARARDVISKETPEELYSSKRELIQDEIKKSVEIDLLQHFNPVEDHRQYRWVHIEDILIRSITLPPEVADAIVHKNEQSQLTQEYEFRLLREEKEAERKRIEATGIKQFQDVVGASITDNYLRLRGIEATLSLAQSPNAKIVILGSGKDGMPLIINLGDDQSKGTSSATASQSRVAPPRNTNGISEASQSAAPTDAEKNPKVKKPTAEPKPVSNKASSNRVETPAAAVDKADKAAAPAVADKPAPGAN